MTKRHDFVKAVAATIKERHLLKGGEKVVLAVSGGPDSLALLHSMHALAPALDLTLHVAHFDHRWRADSASDAVFVRRQADRLDIDCSIGTAESAAPLPGRSPEESARTRRLRFLSETAEAVGAGRIATGHTLDDQAETVMMRMLIGAGKRGLGGIPPVRWYYIRPLLDARRSDVEAYCRSLRLKPLRDPTNEDTSLLRNQVRLHTLPFLREQVNRRIDEQLARAADIARDEDYYLDRQASAQAAPEVVEGGSRLSIERLRDMPVALQRRAIRLLARNEGPGINAEHTEAVRELSLKAKTGSGLDLPGRLSVRVEYGFIVVGTAPSSPLPRDTVELTIPGQTELVSWGLRFDAWVSQDRPLRWPDGRQRCVLDMDRLDLPLRVRRWRSGDAFRPLGMSRKKKIGDFFTDERVPGRTRREVPLVVAQDDAVVWVAGHRIDDRFKVTEATSSCLWVAAEGS